MGKVVEVFNRDRRRLPEFREDGAITYDERGLSYEGKPELSLKAKRQIILEDVAFRNPLATPEEIAAANLPVENGKEAEPQGIEKGVDKQEEKDRIKKSKTKGHAVRGKRDPLKARKYNQIATGATAISLSTLGERITVPLALGEYQVDLLRYANGQRDLVQKNGDFYLYVTLDVPEPSLPPATAFLGVDLGVVNLATTSDGKIFSGAEVERVRVHYFNKRRALQIAMARKRKKGKRPRSIKKALKRIGNKEARFRRHQNHCMTKQLVVLAKGTDRGVALENLTHIRKRTRFRKNQRARMGGWRDIRRPLNSTGHISTEGGNWTVSIIYNPLRAIRPWSFAQWRMFCEYKSRKYGVPFVVVVAAYTFQTGSSCHYCSKENRIDQATFKCQQCGFTAHADINAALNIASRD